MKRALYTLSAAAVLLGAAPAISLADAASESRPAKASCQCAAMRAHAPAGAAVAREEGATTGQGDDVAAHDEGFLRQVWSAP